METSDCNSNESILIVKYGGSAITDKATFETLKSQELERAADQLNQVYNGDVWSQIIVVHGAGNAFKEVFGLIDY